MKLTVIGSGYVGLVVGAGFANLGNEVICLDIDKEKIDKLNKGIIPIYEPGLSDLVKRGVRENRLFFTTDKKKAIEHGQVIFIAVGTPSKTDGSVDLQYVDAVAKDIALYMNEYKIIVNKSTVPVGTADKVKKIIKENKGNAEFDVVSNPEFLREGAAVKDFQNPERIIIGADSEKARDIMKSLYKGIERTGRPIVFTGIKSAEIIKYASNAMLATRISFMNEMSRLCEKVGANVKQVSRGMGLDTRIGPRFLQAGVGYGGSCFPKDVRGFIDTAKQNGLQFNILEAVDKVNEEQKRSLIPKIQKLVPDLKDKKIAVWGLAFKPRTDDMREAPSLIIISELQKLGAKIAAFDPEARETAKKVLKDVEYTETAFDAVKDADCLVLVTEWDEFRHLDMEKVKSLMKQPNLVDGRNIYEPEEMKELGFNYLGVGR
ncbi:UDP-glucose/GDP-mannose dehydrogenase family protein [Candidatus Woesearchaeota archaeon]|nr:UDP-glucose/GDP-mannose dehydrogenase family protein [Candidatus Woesearchaeota archaeon]